MISIVIRTASNKLDIAITLIRNNATKPIVIIAFYSNSIYICRCRTFSSFPKSKFKVNIVSTKITATREICV